MPVRTALTKNAFDVCIAVLILAVCLIMFATQEVSPYTADGWYESRSRIFGREPGGDNHTPVGVPAFLYFTLHVAAKAAGWGLRGDFYAASLAHNLLLAGSALLLYATHRLLGLPRLGALASLALIFLVQSTFVTQGCWSENTSLPLNAATIFLLVLLATQPALSARAVAQLSAATGLLLGFSVITRMIPLLLLPAMVWFVWRLQGRARAQRFGMIAAAVVAAMLVTAGAANRYRYGRFELANSTGRHLWSGMREISEPMLRESEAYQNWKLREPDLPGKPWWFIQTVPQGQALDVALREMILPGLARHPILFLDYGLRRAWGCYHRGLGQFGYVPLATNPLQTPALLPAPVVPWDGYRDLLHRLGGFADRWFWLLYLGIVLSGTVRMSFRRTDATWRTLWLFLAIGYFLPTTVNWIIEQPEPRYAIPYLSTLALLASVSFASVQVGPRRD